MSYIVTEIISPKIITAHHNQHGNQTWVLSNTPIRKGQDCAICYLYFAPRGERMFRPLGNPQNRWERICIKCGTG